MNTTPEEFLPRQSPEFLSAERIAAGKRMNLVALVIATVLVCAGFLVGFSAALCWMGTHLVR